MKICGPMGINCPCCRKGKKRAMKKILARNARRLSKRETCG